MFSICPTICFEKVCGKYYICTSLPSALPGSTSFSTQPVFRKCPIHRTQKKHVQCLKISTFLYKIVIKCDLTFIKLTQIDKCNLLQLKPIQNIAFFIFFIEQRRKMSQQNWFENVSGALLNLITLPLLQNVSQMLPVLASQLCTVARDFGPFPSTKVLQMSVFLVFSLLRSCRCISLG